ncbi:MAG: prolyl oligopeptidase family serine peptidase [Hyphomicrobium denitrificans]|nr:prolyl oligopeptidase family serine peptidase [Hyphomicrobium denitrificans]
MAQTCAAPISSSGSGLKVGSDPLLAVPTSQPPICHRAATARLNAHDPATASVEQLWEQPGAGFEASRYDTLISYAEASDGVRVPISLLKLRATPCNGSAPLLLYGYGAYGHCCEPSFDPAVLSLVDRGWVYAIAHVRGGGENGRGWHEAGRGRSKPNSFSDFAACANGLVQEGYTAAGRIVAQGASAGGLLVGAALDLAPGLFGGVIAEVPFVDVLNSQSDYTLPLTQPECAEWVTRKTSQRTMPSSLLMRLTRPLVQNPIRPFWRRPAFRTDGFPTRRRQNGSRACTPPPIR